MNRPHHLWSCGSVGGTLALLAPFVAHAQGRLTEEWVQGGHGTGGIEAIAVSADEQIMATAGNDATVKLWRVSDGALLRTLTGTMRPRYGFDSVALSPDGAVVAASQTADGLIFLWGVADGALLSVHNPGAGWRIGGLTFSPDGQFLASGGSDGIVRVWRLEDWSLALALNTQATFVDKLAFSPDGTLLASGDPGRTVKLWSMPAGVLVRSLGGHRGHISDIEFSRDGQLLASSSYSDYEARLWRVADGSLIRTFSGDSEWIWSVALSPTGDLLAAVDGWEVARIWRIDDGTLVQELLTAKWPQHATFLDSGRELLTVGNMLQTWRSADGAMLRRWGDAPVSRTVFWSRDGQLILAPDANDFRRSIQLRTARDGGLIGELGDVRGYAEYAALSPNGRFLAVSGSGSGIAVWELAEQRLAAEVSGSYTTFGLAFAPRGRLLAVGGRQSVRLWDTRTGELLRTLNGHADIVLNVAFSPDGSVLASGGWNDGIRLWRVATGLPLATLPGARSVRALAFAPTGRTLAASLSETISPHDEARHWVRLFDRSTGSVKFELDGHAYGINALSFDANGKVLATASMDSTIRFWETDTGELLHTHSHETGTGVLSLAFSPDQSHILYSRADGTLVVISNPCSAGNGHQPGTSAGN